MDRILGSHEGDLMPLTMGNNLGDNNSMDQTNTIHESLYKTVGLSGTAMSVMDSFTGDVTEGSLTGLGSGELGEFDDEQLEQMMMEEEEYGRRQLELAAIEIAKKKKKEEREAKKLEKARLKALEILAAEQQRDLNALEGTDGEVPKKKKRGRRSKAEILAEQMRRDGAPGSIGPVGMPGLPSVIPSMSSVAPVGSSDIAMNSSIVNSPIVHPAIVNPMMNANSPILNPNLPEMERMDIPIMTGLDGQLYNPDGSPLKPKRRGRGKRGIKSTKFS